MNKKCRICNRDLPIIRGSTQKYCDKELRNCAKVALVVKMNVKNQQKLMSKLKKYKRCLEVKTEQGIKKHCKKCLSEMYSGKCKTCGVGVKGVKKFCTERVKEKVSTKNLCRTCNLGIPSEGSKQARFCSETCKKNRPNKLLAKVKDFKKQETIEETKDKQWDIDPKFLVRGLK